MNANARTIPEADDIDSISPEAAAQLMTDRVAVICPARSGGEENYDRARSLAEGLWPLCAARAALSEREMAIQAKMSVGISRSKAEQIVDRAG